MSEARLHLDAALAIVGRDARLLLSYRARLASQLASVVISLALFYYLSRLIGGARFGSPEAYFGFAVVGIALLQVLTATLMTLPTTVRTELMTGTFERLVVSPFGAVPTIVAMVVFPVAMALVVVVTTFVVGAALFGLDLQWSTAPLALPVAVLACLAFVPLSLVFVALLVTVKAAGAGTTYLVTLLTMTSGAYFPTDLLPPWLRWLSEVQPMTPALDLLRHLLVGTPLDDPAAGEVLRLVVFAVVLLPIALWLLSRCIDAARRRDTLIEW